MVLLLASALNFLAQMREVQRAIAVTLVVPIPVTLCWSFLEVYILATTDQKVFILWP